MIWTATGTVMHLACLKQVGLRLLMLGMKLVHNNSQGFKNG
ncbi:hypothetical protein OXIME_000974 [Oxyplasma meridianum]|uniref:Uncharacterized protein n=1 Tax=Oxyplasma meridianum TaxID=3073602 RepID=A0AAX4NGK8_9ARCH